METQLSQLKNKSYPHLIAVILCAGKGRRIKKIFPSTPKALIKIESLNNITILDHLLDILLDLEIDNIEVIIGHLSNQIEEHFLNMQASHPLIKEKINLINSGKAYRKGSLHSFLSITKNIEKYTSKDLFILFPGDTIFSYSLIENIIYVISNNIDLFLKYPGVFYQVINKDEINQTHKEFISILETFSENNSTFLERISQIKVKELKFPKIKKVVPIITFPYNTLICIIQDRKKKASNTIRALINSLIKQESQKIIAFKLNSDFKFYDIDTKQDLLALKKKVGQ
jgi:NDP-sugar pyrophosphorylase family protein